MPSSLREALAALEHDQWAHWTRYMLGALKEVIGLGFYEARDNNIDLSVVREHLARWERQIATPYAELTEAEKDSDREWADKVLAVLDSDRLWVEQARAEIEAFHASGSLYPPMRAIYVGNLPPEREGVWPDEAIDAMAKSMTEVEDERILADTLAWVDAQNLSSDFLKYDPSLPVRLVVQTPNGVTESVWVDAENPDRIVGIPTPDAMRLIREDEDRQLSLPFGDGR